MANIAMLVQSNRRLLGFARLLASYGCADQGEKACGECGPCEAHAWLEERDLLTPPSGRSAVSRREDEVLRSLDGEWVRPMDIGGRDSNDVSRVLNRLVRKGYVEMKRRAGHCRPSYLYRKL